MNEVDSDSQGSALRAIAEKVGVSLESRAVERLQAYLDLLKRWNATYNLTAVRDAQAMLTHHVADCLAVVPALRRELGDGARRVLDVGSGGGLPGVVIAIACPSWQVVCVDTVGKKAAFIRQVGLELGLTNLQAEHGRVEKLSPGHFDLVIARAFSSLADLVALTRSHLAPMGMWAAMKGKPPDDEIARLPHDVTVFHVEQVDVPGLPADRCLVWMRPAR